MLDMLLINLVIPWRSQTTLMSLSSENAYITLYFFFLNRCFEGTEGLLFVELARVNARRGGETQT